MKNKKKNFANLCNHNVDFGIEAEWHFFATAHGKGPCDGVAGSTKRLATRASLQRGAKRAILNPLQLFEWAKVAIKNINFFYVDNDDYEETEAFLKDRFSQSVTVKGTLNYHSYIPLSDRREYVKVKAFSNSAYSKIVKERNIFMLTLKNVL